MRMINVPNPCFGGTQYVVFQVNDDRYNSISLIFDSRNQNQSFDKIVDLHNLLSNRLQNFTSNSPLYFLLIKLIESH